MIDRNRNVVLVSAVLLALAGCSSVPPAPVEGRGAERVTPPKATPPDRAPMKFGGGYKDDGPGDNPPADLDSIPDAIPRAEPLHRFANKPYVALGQSYTPDTELKSYKDSGHASWYGRRYHGQRTSSGESYDMYGMTAAHRTLPIPSYARVTNPVTQRSVVVRINDRGPFHPERIIDVSYTAAHKLGILQGGSGRVVVESIDPRNFTAASPLPAPAPLAAPKPENPPPPAPLAAAPDAGGLYVQLGAFSVQDNAEQFRYKLKIELTQLADKLQVSPANGMFKVRAGPYASQVEANQVASEIRKALSINAVVTAR